MIRKMTIADYPAVYALWLANKGIGKTFVSAAMDALTEQGITKAALVEMVRKDT